MQLQINPRCLESGVAEAIEGCRDATSKALYIELSIAISLKRLADHFAAPQEVRLPALSYKMRKTLREICTRAPKATLINSLNPTAKALQARLLIKVSENEHDPAGGSIAWVPTEAGMEVNAKW